MWLEYMGLQKGVHIRHALNSEMGEYKIPGTRWRVDGWIEPSEAGEKGTVLEFYG